MTFTKEGLHLIDPDDKGRSSYWESSLLPEIYDMFQLQQRFDNDGVDSLEHVEERQQLEGVLANQQLELLETMLIEVVQDPVRVNTERLGYIIDSYESLLSLPELKGSGYRGVVQKDFEVQGFELDTLTLAHYYLNSQTKQIDENTFLFNAIGLKTDDPNQPNRLVKQRKVGFYLFDEKNSDLGIEGWMAVPVEEYDLFRMKDETGDEWLYEVIKEQKLVKTKGYPEVLVIEVANKVERLYLDGSSIFSNKDFIIPQNRDALSRVWIRGKGMSGEIERFGLRELVDMPTWFGEIDSEFDKEGKILTTTIEVAHSESHRQVRITADYESRMMTIRDACFNDSVQTENFSIHQYYMHENQLGDIAHLLDELETNSKSTDFNLLRGIRFSKQFEQQSAWVGEAFVEGEWIGGKMYNTKLDNIFAPTLRVCERSLYELISDPRPNSMKEMMFSMLHGLVFIGNPTEVQVPDLGKPQRYIPVITFNLDNRISLPNWQPADKPFTYGELVRN